MAGMAVFYVAGYLIEEGRRWPVYARWSKISHQSALECVTVVDFTTHSNPPSRSAIVALAYICPV